MTKINYDQWTFRRGAIEAEPALIRAAPAIAFPTRPRVLRSVLPVRNARRHLLAAIAAAVSAIFSNALMAQDADGPDFAPALLLKLDRAIIRTPEQISAAENTEPWRRDMPTPRGLMDFLHFRPPGAAAYFNFSNPLQTDSPPQPMLGSSAAETAAAVTGTFAGASQTGGYDRADCDGAVSDTQYVEVVNTSLIVYARTSVALGGAKSMALWALFDASDGPFHPRVIYDPKWKRWIVVSTRYPVSSTDPVQRFYMAVSTTADATGSYYIYKVPFAGAAGDYLDFPALGMDQDAVIATGNIYNPWTNWTWKGAMVAVLAKADVYNGLASGISYFYGIGATVAPPIVLDNNASTYLLAAPPSGKIWKFTLTDSSRNPATLQGPSLISVSPSYPPPDTPQPGTADVLRTADANGEFCNRSTQTGNLIWQTQAINAGGRSTVRWFCINTASNAVIQSGLLSASPTSSDFNPSIAANANNDVFVTWNSTDPVNGVNVQIWTSGKHFADGAMPHGAAVFGSPAFFSETSNGIAPWGDYSAVSIDPTNPETAWIVNEKINSTTVWGTGIVRMGF